MVEIYTGNPFIPFDVSRQDASDDRIRFLYIFFFMELRSFENPSS